MSVMLLPRAILAAALLCFAVFTASAEVAVPPLKARVTDLTGTLSAERIAELDRQLAAFEAKKGAQIAVLMVPTVQPETVEQYAVRAFEQWKLGRKGVDDGVLLVIAKSDRKLRIEVGYGLEGALTDATSKRIISDDIVPQFKRGDFTAGVVAGVSRIMAVIDGEALPPVAASQKGRADLPFNPEWLLAGFVLFNVINLGLRAAVGQLAAAGIMAGLFGFIIWLVFSSVIGASIAGVIAFVFSLFAGAKGSFGGGYGGSGGGGSWSSGGGGGGFGGGGGRSGGGGASGSW
ncbi:MAG: TPM domain-containing protein [Betaproteobacteria bacterium]